MLTLWGSHLPWGREYCLDEDWDERVHVATDDCVWDCVMAASLDLFDLNLSGTTLWRQP